MRKNNDDPVRGPSSVGLIVVVGGYGAVGRVTAKTLGEWFPGQVVVAGRDLSRAERVARSSEGALKAMRVDVNDLQDVERMVYGAAIVVMCVERGNEAVARTCLSQGVHYVDISASAPVLESIERLDALAVSRAATAVLSVGVAPGLTNVLARRCVERLPSAERVDINLFLGMGGDHGVDSVRWIVEHLTEPGDRHRSDVKHARVRLPEVGLRTVYPFPFSDQYTVSDVLGVRATTRICFDSALTTSAIFALRAMGFFPLMRRLRAAPLLTSLLSRLHFGSDRFVVHALASDAEGMVVSSTAVGRETCDATGIVAAYVARVLYTGTAPGGVLHIDQLVSADLFLDELERHWITVHHKEAEPAAQNRRGR
ncbi:saccharopine dehydrogenase NADP-binding domain-containing protein [Nonomuraea sp. NPDC048916]|uniref:saccharopine dehydrogenase family protein n=1 Tax=Nonomuraea sp. NPDC048916 TaxID=3154232 RepID=UPI0033EDB537